MNRFALTASLTAPAAALALSLPAHAAVAFDQDVTPDVIFGSGNANGSFTTDRTGDLELGLRGKLRFNAANAPENTFNSNGDGTYTFENVLPPTGFGFDPGSPTTPVWNFEWSINTDYQSPDGTSSTQLDDYDYVLSLDADPSAGTNFQTFDPINVSYADHSLGNNTTVNGGGIEAITAVEYDTLIGDFNVAQNSWSYEFFNDVAPLTTFDPTDIGVYTIKLEAFAKGTIGTAPALSTTSIDIVVPEPASLGLLGLGGLCLVGRRRGRG